MMLLGALVPGLRRLYSLQEYVSALLLVGGLILFTLADAASSPNFQVLGVAMVCTALLLDAILGNMQEAIFAVNPATSQVSRTPLRLPRVAMHDTRLLPAWGEVPGRAGLTEGDGGRRRHKGGTNVSRSTGAGGKAL